MAPTEKEALSTIEDAAVLAVENAGQAVNRLRMAQRAIDTVWLTPEGRKEAIDLVAAYYQDALRSLDTAVSQLRAAPVASAATYLASGQCAPEEDATPS
jgi:hypothetical protein